MDRIERTQMKGKQLFGAPPDNRNAPDGELLDILQRFGFGEAFWQEGLDDAMRELITAAILTVNQTLPQLEAHTAAALRVGCTPEAVVEAVYQCAPYIGFPKALCAAAAVRKALAAQGGCEPQVTAHVRGNLAVGNDKQTLLAALLHGILYIGFPRTLNALACLNQVCSEA